jgi:hypothetical protein
LWDMGIRKNVMLFQKSRPARRMDNKQKSRASKMS